MNEGDLRVRAHSVLLETRTGFKKLFIEHTPIDILRQTVDLAESSTLAGQSVAHFIATHTFRFYLKSRTPDVGRVELTPVDRDFIEYALALIDFAVKMTGEATSSASLAVHEHVLTMIYDTHDELESLPSVEERILHGKALCLISWINRNYYQRIQINDEERSSHLPFIIENMAAIEPRIRMITQRGSSRPDDIAILLASHPSLGEGAL